MKITVSFEYEKSTKRTHRYQEVGDDKVIGTLYVQKSALPQDRPDTLTVTLEIEDV